MVGEVLEEEGTKLVLVLVFSVLVSRSMGVLVSVAVVVEELNGVVEEDASGGHLGKSSVKIGLLPSMLFSPHPEV